MTEVLTFAISALVGYYAMVMPVSRLPAADSRSREPLMQRHQRAPL